MVGRVQCRLTDGGRAVRSLGLSLLLLALILNPLELPRAWLILLLLPLLLLGLAWLLGRRRLDGLALESLACAPGFAATRQGMAVDLRHDGPRVLRDLVLRHHGRTGPGLCFAAMPSLQPGDQGRLHGLLFLPRRGHYRRLTIHVETSFPWQLWRWTRQDEVATDFHSWPRLGQWRALDLLLTRLPTTRGQVGRPSDQGELFHGLEEWRPGRSLRQIHWRSSARRAKLMIRRFEEESRGRLRIALLAPHGELDEATARLAFERSLSLLATLAEGLTRQGRRAELSVPSASGWQQYSIGTKQAEFFRLLNALAELDPPPNTIDLAGADKAAVRIQAGAGVAFSAQGIQLDPLDPAMRQWYREARSWALPTAQVGSHSGLNELRQRLTSADDWTEADDLEASVMPFNEEVA